MASNPGDVPAFSASEPQMSLAPNLSSCSPENTSTSGSLRGSLQQRRSKQGLGLGLNMDTIVSSSREGLAPPPTDAQARFRGWEMTSIGEGMTDAQRAQPGSVKVVAYNILAGRYATSDKYVHCPMWALSEPFRHTNIVAEVEGAAADIIVFEELPVGATTSSEFGQALSGRLGYDWYHVPVTAPKKGATSNSGSDPSDWSGGNERPEHEGVGIYWKRDRFELVEGHPLRFNTLAQRDAALAPGEKKRVAINSHNVAAICALADKQTGAIIVVSGIHAYWDWNRPECQLWQQVRLVEQVASMVEAYETEVAPASVIMCGDFNSEMRATPVQWLLQGQLQYSTGAVFEGLRDATHTLRLETAYAEYAFKHPKHVTAIGNAFSGMIDYVFFDATAFDCAAVGKLDKAAEIPNGSVPSDHYPVAAWLVPKPRPAA